MQGVTYKCDFCEHRVSTRSNLNFHVDANHQGINSNAIAVETPEKSEPETMKLDEESAIRSTPSKELKSMLKAVERFHVFCHSAVIVSIEVGAKHKESYS